jgi:choline dehydrogenase-like flavoprotein
MPEDVLQQTYDAIVVGSGATGGWAAKRLSEAGLKVALLEAGRTVTAREFTEHIPTYQLGLSSGSAMPAWNTTTNGS